jgi:antibiotic biosynthesis monooxygenase
MKHVRVATYDIKQGSFEELAGIVREEMMRVFRNQPGFIKYGLADLGDDKCLSLSLWETRQDADAANAVSADWVRDLMSDRVELRTNEVGDLAFYEGIPATV